MGTALRFPHAFGAAPPPPKKATSSPTGWVGDGLKKLPPAFCYLKGAKSRGRVCALEHLLGLHKG